jgi:hypothetical protein
MEDHVYAAPEGDQTAENSAPGYSSLSTSRLRARVDTSRMPPDECELLSLPII